MLALFIHKHYYIIVTVSSLNILCIFLGVKEIPNSSGTKIHAIREILRFKKLALKKIALNRKIEEDSGSQPLTIGSTSARGRLRVPHRKEIPNQTSTNVS